MKCTKRLAEEFELIQKTKITEYFLKICDIIDLTSDQKHMTRGSQDPVWCVIQLGITDKDPQVMEYPKGIVL